MHFLAALIFAAPSHATPATCIRYEPDTVHVTGQLTRKTFYGAPGFGDDPKHDEKETGFYLELSSPICTQPGADDVDTAKTGIRIVQLVLDSAGYARLRPFVGQRVTLKGTLFGAISGHHHAPVLLDVTRPVKVGR